MAKKVSNYMNESFRKQYEKAARYLQQLYEEVIGEIKKVKNIETILDAGCGNGRLTEQLARSWNVIGIDTSREWIKANNLTYGMRPNPKYHIGDATDLSLGQRPLKDKEVDAVVLNMVLPNIASRKAVNRIFKESYRVLKPGGIFVFTDLHPDCVTNCQVPGRSLCYGNGFNKHIDGSHFRSTIALHDTAIEFESAYWTQEKNLQALSGFGFQCSTRTVRNSAKPEFIMYTCRK